MLRLQHKRTFNLNSKTTRVNRGGEDEAKETGRSQTAAKASGKR